MNNQGDGLNNDNITMKNDNFGNGDYDNQIESLHKLEKNVLTIGKEIGKIFATIENSIETNDYNASFDFEKTLDPITSTKEELHKKVDELYSKRSYFYMNQLDNDIQERENQKKQIIDFIFPKQKNNL